jgi:hypothetical protein
MGGFLALVETLWRDDGPVMVSEPEAHTSVHENVGDPAGGDDS